METRRFMLVMAALTAVFCAAVILYNFQIMPPYGSAGVSAVTVLPTGTSSAPPSAASALSSGTGRSGTVAAADASETTPAVSRPASAVSGKTSSAKTSSAAASYPIDINTADARQLAELPGIGDTLAGRIIDYRLANGAFTSIDQLDNVKGIGPKTIEELRPYATV